MPFIETGFSSLLIYEPLVHEDSRGYFFEAYNKKDFEKAGVRIDFIQDNQSSSQYGVVRGLHYQLNPFAQTKLIRVLSGTILDVAVDIRKNSSTFGKSFVLELSAENKKQLLIPNGFAHGFSVVSQQAEVFYKCDQFYNKDAEQGICFNDVQLNIDWKIPDDKMIVSEKDKSLPSLENCQCNFIF